MIIVWKLICKRLSINSKLSTVFHLQINKQTKRVNQNVKRQLRTYCNYMQNNWVNCLLIIEFINNNILSASIKIIFFFVNKGFHFRMSFSLNFTSYISTRERLQTAKIEVITDSMKKTLRVMTIKAKVAKNTMIMQVNKYKKKFIYKKDDMIILSSWNIKTIKSVNKLKDKMLSLF